MKRIYLDNSFLNRPFDNQEIIQNRIEREILFLILDLIKQDRFILVNSAVIEYENSLNPFLERRVFVQNILKLAKIYQNLDKDIFLRAKALMEKFKLKNIDALHIACAEKAKVHFLITCDYDLVKKYKSDKIKIIRPIDFFEKYKNEKN